MFRTSKIVFLFLFSVLFFSACDNEPDPIETGRLKLFLTDAPLDTDGITGVFITFSEIHYHIQGDHWVVFDEFDEAVTVNLMDYTHGETLLMGYFEMPPGTYTQLRFMLEAPEHGQGPPTNPGCYVMFEDGSTEPLFVPSGSQSGYKATGQFSIPLNGVVDVTADFDLRNSIVVTGGNASRYILKPTIRLVVNNEAGRIVGDVYNIPEDQGAVVYAYEAGTYTEEEAEDPADMGTRFPNAINSDMVCENNKYHLDFLAEGMYDLVVASTFDGEFLEVAGIAEGVEVIAGQTTNYPIDLSEL